MTAVAPLAKSSGKPLHLRGRPHMEFLPDGGQDGRGAGETMSKRPRRNHSPAFKAKVALPARSSRLPWRGRSFARREPSVLSGVRTRARRRSGPSTWRRSRGRRSRAWAAPAASCGECARRSRAGPGAARLPSSTTFVLDALEQALHERRPLQASATAYYLAARAQTESEASTFGERQQCPPAWLSRGSEQGRG